MGEGSLQLFNVVKEHHYLNLNLDLKNLAIINLLLTFLFSINLTYTYFLNTFYQ
jgi:hypothetical protein